MAIFFNFLLTSNHLHLLQVENCGSNLRLVVDEDDNGKLRLERVNTEDTINCFLLKTLSLIIIIALFHEGEPDKP